MEKFILLFSLILIPACGSEEAEPAPRSRDEIFRDTVNLPSLYMTDSGERIEAPRIERCFVDQKTGKLFWMALECTNPKCPAKLGGGKPHIFIMPDPGIYVNKKGELGFDSEAEEQAIRKGGFLGCKKCFPLRQRQMLSSGRGAETQAEKIQYAEYVVPHVLPESWKRRKELEKEMASRVAWEKENHR